MAELHAYENQHGANESTYWLYFELLWREYFQWLQLRYNSKMYTLRGIRNQDPLLAFDPKSFAEWCEGHTDAPFVNVTVSFRRDRGGSSSRAAGALVFGSCSWYLNTTSITCTTATRVMSTAPMSADALSSQIHDARSPQATGKTRAPPPPTAALPHPTLRAST